MYVALGLHRSRRDRRMRGSSNHEHPMALLQRHWESASR